MKRASATAALRAYDGAQANRRTASLAGRGTSANSEIAPALSRLRDRSRDLARNTPIGKRTLQILDGHVVGTGITVRWNTGNRTLDRRLTRMWKKWARACDIEGVLDFHGLVKLAHRASREGGDALVRMMTIDTPKGVHPLRLKVLEGDFLDESRVAASAFNRRVMMGVELDENDARVGYWLRSRHPGEMDALRPVTLQSTFIDRQDICHLYAVERPGQVRGVPVFAPSMLSIRDYQDLLEALIVKGRMEAAHALVIKTAGAGGNLATAKPGEAPDPNDDGKIRPGMRLRLQPGEDVEVIDPSKSGGFDAITIQVMMMIAAGVDVTYDQLTGDLRQANYSSLRAGKIEFRRIVEQFQYLCLVPMLIDRIVDRWISDAILHGDLRERAEGYEREYVMPMVEPIDPLKDLQADILAVRAGRMSPQDFIEAWGRPADDVMSEFETFFADIDARGIVLDIDPRHQTKAGTAQPVAADQAPPQN